MIQVSAQDRRVLRWPWSVLLANKMHEWWIKGTGRRIKGQGMIGADERTVRDGFAALRGKDFDVYNLPQVWVERRQVPIAIDGRVPRVHANVIDLGCGPGSSTEVLCYFADPSWTITGFDLIPHAVDAARQRSEAGGFRNRAGRVVRPRFVCQNIANPLQIDGRPLADASVDFAISGGVVGLYLQREQVRRLAGELARVVKIGGFVALDAGPATPAAPLRAILASAGFGFVRTCKSFFVEPRPKLVFRRG